MAKCTYCGGTGQFQGGICPQCLGGGVAKGPDEIIQSIVLMLETKIDTANSKLDALKIVSDKMSSNLDDIMVKLDV